MDTPGDLTADDELIARTRGGDSRAFGRLVDRHQGVVFRYLLGMLADEDRAADATQETFVKAYTKLDLFRGDAAFRTWLLAIARNQGREALRRRQRNREDSVGEEWELEGEADAVDEQVHRSVEADRVRKALVRLPEKQRLSVSLRLFDGLSFREVGEATGSSEGAARVNYHHGIRRLREWLDDDNAR